jgi:hypothetical protein
LCAILYFFYKNNPSFLVKSYIIYYVQPILSIFIKTILKI